MFQIRRKGLWKKMGVIFGMLSVHRSDGEVWYYDWHGKYIQTMKIKRG
jgi:hypothetical protein